MRIASATLLILSAFALSACGGSADQADGDAAAEFAARINASSGAAPQPAATPPSVAPPLDGAVPGVFEAGTATDPAAAICDATNMGPYMGREATDAVRSEILLVASAASEVRFVSPGPVYVKPDPTSSRLNIMLDARNIIRDARCG